MNIKQVFIKIWESKIYNKEHALNLIAESIPSNWRYILFTDASFTRSINVLNIENIRTELVKQTTTIPISKTRHGHNNNIEAIGPYLNRVVWLKSKDAQYLAFATSYWYSQHNHKAAKIKQPIGQFFIENESDIHRELISIYYGHSNKLKGYFTGNSPMWGKEYCIYFLDKPVIFINEIFSEYLLIE